MTRPRVLVIDPQWEDAPDLELALAGEDAELVFRRSVNGRLENPEDYAAADAVLNCRSMHLLPAEAIARFTRCRVIVQGGVGFGHIDLAAAAARGIPVLNTPDYGTTEVADHAVALALGLLRGLQAYDRRLRRGNAAWDARQMKQVRRLGSLRLGILGLGRIGTAAALRFQAFGMKVGFHDPFLPVGHQLAFGWERFATPEALLARSDVLSIHAPLNDGTRGLLDARRLALLPPGAVVVNTARGGILDLDALGDALRSGHLSGAGLDVFEAEPLDRGHPLIAAWAAGEAWLDDRLVLTPHAAFFSSASIRDIRRLSMQYMMDFLCSGARPTCVNEGLLAGQS
ncbi:C-terminal binding protein [Falsiroseomonas tokyonensis]|uniref:C-terminal binding protein n=1 Tax=Falsiroseomonas tokyonensis TaxID=430521 RepID=A0ABV7BVD3_9PROT|nr:C-terminal binding protein [Falsiroseomonas tokyonensis]MBU8539620.1 C-terminal binding protein [Falsiroseomonas tokyonensis]